MNGADFGKRQRITLGMKTKGMVAVTIETDPKDKDGAGLIWASWCVQNLDGVKVDIKDI